MRKFGLCLVGLVAVLAFTQVAFAGGSQVYPNGAEGFWVGAAPPPGNYYLNYDLWYLSNRFNGQNGSELTAGPAAGFKVDVFANVSRFIHISQEKVLGANWGAHIFLVYKDVNVSMAAGNSHVSGLGDIIVDPVILCWHWPNFHITAGIDVYLPTGDYKQGRLANLGSNVFVYEPVVAFSYMTPMKGLTVSAKFMYDIAQKTGSGVHPLTGAFGAMEYGNEFHVDYSLDYAVNNNLKAGIGGYYYKQTTNDKFNGVEITGNMGRVWAVGPGVEYTTNDHKTTVSFRSQFEIDARNRPEGIANWLRAVFIL